MRARGWVAAFLVVLGVFGFGQLEAWPFTSWYMFSHVEPSPARIARAYAVLPGGAEPLLADDVLPYGLLSHRLLRRVNESRTDADRRALCSALLRATQRRHPGVAEVKVLEQVWDPLERTPGNHPVLTIAERVRCRP